MASSSLVCTVALEEALLYDIVCHSCSVDFSLWACMCSFFNWFSEVNQKEDGEDDENVFLEIQDEVMPLSCVYYFTEILFLIYLLCFSGIR